MMLKRVMGKACFATLQDMSRPHPALRHARRRRRRRATTRSSTGTSATSSAPTGTLFKTKTGELSVKCDSVRLLAKALRPLPDKFHGLTDQEQTLPAALRRPHHQRRRRATCFVKRSQIVQAIREFLVARGFLEVETPMMHPIPGGAAARPFVTHHNALDMELSCASRPSCT